MKTIHAIRPFRVVTWVMPAVLALVWSCTDQSGPTDVPLTDSLAVPEAHLLRHLPSPRGLLLQCEPLPEATASRTIGPGGGVLRVGPHRLVVPPGALDDWVTITAVAPSDTVNAVRFEPHGLNFDRSAYLTMSYANCEGVGTLLPKRIAYTSELFEILEFLLSFDNFWRREVTGRLDHFSQYALAW